jgi:tRNA(Ile)-lysidine synthase TilS/MesJ
LSNQFGVVARDSFREKLDLFMRLHVVNEFDPEDIRWWLSLSGGKDSFAMAHGLREWYSEKGLRFNAVPFTIDQWHGQASVSIVEQIDWANVTVIDGHMLTMEKTKYVPGAQAPCRLCADARRDLTDSFVAARANAPLQNSQIDVVGRGLHLTDNAISLLWRFVMGKNPARDMLASGKGKPVTKLGNQKFLAKPLYYVREYESQEYATLAGHRHACCGCPACKFPSRRDIVEETVADLLRGSLWEFDIPGMFELLTEATSSADMFRELQQMSAPGTEKKKRHLPEDFAYLIAAEYVSRWKVVQARIADQIDMDMDLDAVGMARLRSGASSRVSEKIPVPGLFRATNQVLPGPQLNVIATMGPFWGAIGLTGATAARAWALQEEHFGLVIDERWSQVGEMLRRYYAFAPAGLRQKTPLIQIS